ncbi:PAS domain-containing protein [Curvivirga sp.]|uniref:PAS domain-containing protein n=1 Tax=Curvivirga sp. TaxID=2856848 RepID=UPI003B58F480
MSIINKIKEPELIALYEYWCEIKGERLAPSRSDFHPMDIPKLLPHIFLYDVLKDYPDYRMRLFGSALVEALGRDVTGMTFDEIYGGTNDLKRDYDEVVLSLEPSYSEGDANWINTSYLTYHRLLLPMSSDGIRADKLLGMTLFVKKKTKADHYRNLLDNRGD